MSAVVEATDISFAYGKRPVLRGVSVSCRAGEVVALLGPNGSGKSTLLKVLLGQLRAGGTVRWEGKPLREVAGRALARLAAYLPQGVGGAEGETVGEAIALGRYPHWGLLGVEATADRRAAEAAGRAMGVEELWARRVEELSGGQRQRVYLARCLAQGPKALLLDEPDSYLDLRHIAELGRTLRGLAAGGLAVILATHNLALAAAAADRVMLMEDGVAVAEGGVAAVLTAANIGRVFGVRAEVRDGGVWVGLSGEPAG